MEGCSNHLNLMLKMNKENENLLKQKLSSRTGHNKPVKHAYSDKQLQKNTKGNNYSSNERSRYIPVEERVLKRLKRERKFLKKWTVELNQAKSEIHNTTADEFASADSKIAEIQKRYQLLLPAIKLAVETMEQATFSKSSFLTSKDASSMNTQHGDAKCREIQESLTEDATNQGLAKRNRTLWLKESKECILESAKGPYKCTAEKNLGNPVSGNSLMTDYSKQQLAWQARYQHSGSKNTKINIKAKGIDGFKNLNPKPASEYGQPSKRMCMRHVKESSVQLCKPGADGEIMNKANANNHMKPTAQVKDNSPTKSTKLVNGETVLNGIRLVQGRIKVRDETKKTPRQVGVSIDNHLSRNSKVVEQNVLCTGPNPNVMQANSTPSSSGNCSNDTPTDPRSQTSLKGMSNITRSTKSSTEPTKCKCKDKKDSKPCVCKCDCEEETETTDSKLSEEPVLSSVPSSSGEDLRPPRRKPSSEPKILESIQVQTSFPSSIGPCQPDICPKRRKRFVENRDIEVQTDDTDIEWEYQPTVTVKKSHGVKKIVLSPFKIPPKRTSTMDDRLLRRITFFDSHQSSVCNKNVEFCTYNVHLTKKGFPKNAEKAPCSDCPGSRKCNLVFSQHPYHLTCNEVVVEVKSLELNQEGVDSLTKVCSFLYIDYVFLGHVGNETSLAPLSNNILFDSRKSYSVSLRFNKKERSILREQVNPSGLLVKDSIMFIVVCQAAPEFDINKNWDFGFGYLSMKQIGEQIGSEDKISTVVDMQKIGGMKNKIGRLRVTIEGLKTIKSIMNEQLHCIEPRVDSVMEKLKLNKKELIAAENDQTTCKRRICKK